jgi:hypothetical protein
MAVQDTKPQLILRRGLERPQGFSDQQRGLSSTLINTHRSALMSNISPRVSGVEGVL